MPRWMAAWPTGRESGGSDGMADAEPGLASYDRRPVLAADSALKQVGAYTGVERPTSASEMGLEPGIGRDGEGGQVALRPAAR